MRTFNLKWRSRLTYEIFIDNGPVGLPFDFPLGKSFLLNPFSLGFHSFGS